MENWFIRKIEKKRQIKCCGIDTRGFDEMNIPKVGTAYGPYLDLMFEEYSKPKSVYYVVENDGKNNG
jgi:putative acetyltransferase